MQLYLLKVMVWHAQSFAMGVQCRGVGSNSHRAASAAPLTIEPKQPPRGSRSTAKSGARMGAAVRKSPMRAMPTRLGRLILFRRIVLLVVVDFEGAVVFAGVERGSRPIQ